MYRLLIVDDERYIVESLAELFQSQTDIDLEIITAYYGDDALEILKYQKVDLILLDIKMPGLSGIEVARKILSDWPLCKIIFLTGYASFDYIYEIKKMKNTSFLLKTEDNDTIISAVKQAIAEIEKQIKYQQLTSQTERTRMQMEYLVHADILRDLLHGKELLSLKESIYLKGSLFRFDTTKSIYLLYLKVKWNTEANSLVDFHQRIARLSAYFSQHLNQKYILSITDIDSDTFVIFLQPNTGIQSDITMEHSIYIRECLNDCISSPTLDCEMLLLMWNSQINWNQICGTFNLYHQYFLQVLLPVFPQYGRIVLCTEELLSNLHPDNYLNDIAASQSVLSMLSSGLLTGNKEKINQALSQASQILVSFNSMHHLTAISLYHKMSDIYIDFIIQHHLMEKMAMKIGLFKLYNPDSFRSWKELIAYYHKLSTLLLSTVSEEESDSRERTIAQIKTYIKGNLNRNLSLTEISNSVNYNSTYVSRLFRQMTGETLSQYMLRTKITKAKEYLIQSNESIQSISEKLGFDTSQYFSNVFKKHTGFSPRDYRNQSIN